MATPIAQYDPMASRGPQTNQVADELGMALVRQNSVGANMQPQGGQQFNQPNAIAINQAQGQMGVPQEMSSMASLEAAMLMDRSGQTSNNPFTGPMTSDRMRDRALQLEGEAQQAMRDAQAEALRAADDKKMLDQMRERKRKVSEAMMAFSLDPSDPESLDKAVGIAALLDTNPSKEVFLTALDRMGIAPPQELAEPEGPKTKAFADMTGTQRTNVALASNASKAVKQAKEALFDEDGKFRNNASFFKREGREAKRRLKSALTNVLRIESGATISTEEHENAAELYMPNITDSDATAAGKIADAMQKISDVYTGATAGYTDIPEGLGLSTDDLTDRYKAAMKEAQGG